MHICGWVLPVMNEGSRIETGHHHFPGCKKKQHRNILHYLLLTKHGTKFSLMCLLNVWDISFFIGKFPQNFQRVQLSLAAPWRSHERSGDLVIWCCLHWMTAWNRMKIHHVRSGDHDVDVMMFFRAWMSSETLRCLHKSFSTEGKYIKPKRTFGGTQSQNLMWTPLSWIQWLYQLGQGIHVSQTQL